MASRHRSDTRSDPGRPGTAAPTGMQQRGRPLYKGGHCEARRAEAVPPLQDRRLRSRSSKLGIASFAALRQEPSQGQAMGGLGRGWPRLRVVDLSSENARFMRGLTATISCAILTMLS